MFARPCLSFHGCCSHCCTGGSHRELGNPTARLRVPTVGLRGAEQFGGEPAHRGELEPAQPVGEIGCQRRWLPGHDRLPVASMVAAALAAPGMA